MSGETAVIHQFLISQFSDKELQEFCIKYFPGVGNQIGQEMHLKIANLLDYCVQTDKIDDLLVALKHERPNVYEQKMGTIIENRQQQQTKQRPISLVSLTNVDCDLQVVSQHLTNLALTLNQKQTLAIRLLDVPAMRNEQRRGEVISQLSSNIRNSIGYSDNPKAHVLNIIDTCLNYRDGLAELITVIYYFEGSSISMNNLCAFLLSIRQFNSGIPKGKPRLVKIVIEVIVGLIVVISGIVLFSQTVDTMLPSWLSITPLRSVNDLLGSRRTREPDGMEMVFVPDGTFLMGSNPEKDWNATYDEMPQHKVGMKAFWIDGTEVTNAMYAKCVADGECTESGYVNNPDFNGVNQPVVGVSWYDADQYCRWAGGKLPTEAQWEYAARGQTGYLFPWGNDFNEIRLNFCDTNCRYPYKDSSYDDGYKQTSPVGNYESGISWVGAYDMVGNVWEWVQDWYTIAYSPILLVDNPTGPESGQNKVLRGGSWANNEQELRVANRSRERPSKASDFIGFRCIRS